MRKIAAILGDYYHPEGPIREALQAALREPLAAGEYEIVYTDISALPSVLQEAPDAVILFKEDRLNPTDADVRTWFTTDISEQIAAYVENGGGWLAWHSGMASYPADSAYIRMLRGGFTMHPDANQPVTYRGMLPGGTEPVAFELYDEHYFVHCDEESTFVFLRSESVDGRSIAGWQHTYGRGRVCCLTPAHHREGLLQPDFQRVLAASVRSCLSAGAEQEAERSAD